MPLVTIPATGSVGIVADEVAQEIPDGAWSDGTNVRFDTGYAQRFAGHAEVLTTPVAAPYHVSFYSASGAARYWMHATLTGAYADDGTTQTDISGTALTGAAGDLFTSTVLAGVWYLNNQKDVPYYWGGSTASNYASLPGWDSTWRCKSLRSFKNALLALNVSKSTTRYASMVKVSDGVDPGSVPGSWDHTDATTDAVEIDLAETTDELVDGASLGDVFLAYKERSTFGLQYTGGAEVLRWFRVPGDAGVLTQNCIAAAPMGHVVLTPSDVVLQSGNGPQSIVDGRMRRWLFNRIDSTYYQRCFVVHNPARSEVWVCFPENGQTACTQALIWNYKGNTFGVRDLPSVRAGASGPLSGGNVGIWSSDAEPWSTDTTTWQQSDISQADQRLVMAGASKLLLMDQSMQFLGVDFTSSLVRTGMAFGAPAQVKTLRAVYPRVDAPAGTVLQIQAGGSMDAESAPNYSAPVTYTVGQSYKADTFATGRFLALKITGSSGRWRLKSVDVDIVPRGTY